MKKIASLLLLPLLLAACGTQSAPQTLNVGTYQGPSLAPVADYFTSFENQVQGDLSDLGMTGDLAQQAIAPKSYLNVLKVSDSSARAYIKNTYPAATSCSVNWGDGSSSSALTPTPSTTSSEKQDHTYAESGTYTIKLICGADVKTSQFTAVVVSSLNLFDDFVSNGWFYEGGAMNAEIVQPPFPFMTKGFTFNSGFSFMVRNGAGVAPGRISAILHSFEGGSSTISATNGSTFEVKSMTAGAAYAGVIVTAYDSSNAVIGSTTFTNLTNNLVPVEARTLNWKNVQIMKVTSLDGSWSYLDLDDMEAKIN